MIRKEGFLETCVSCDVTVTWKCWENFDLCVRWNKRPVAAGRTRCPRLMLPRLYVLSCNDIIILRNTNVELSACSCAKCAHKESSMLNKRTEHDNIILAYSVVDYLTTLLQIHTLHGHDTVM